MQLQLILSLFSAAASAVLLAALVLSAWLHRSIPRDIAIENMKEAMILLDTRDRIINLNPAARRLINAQTSEVIGQPLHTCVITENITHEEARAF